MMRRRFGRRRWGVGGGGNGGDDGSGRSLDAAQELARVLRLGLVPADALEPVDGDEIPAALAVEVGLASRAVPADELLPEAQRLAGRLAGMPPAARSALPMRRSLSPPP